MSTNKTISYDPDWRKKYPDTIRTAEESVKDIQPGQRIFIGTGAAQPQVLVRALVDRADELVDMEIIQLFTLGAAPYADKKLSSQFFVNNFFVAPNVREAIQEGRGAYTPIFLSDIPRLFQSGQLPLDVALIHVSPPDESGMCSLGVSVDVVKSASENARLVIAQINPQMPRTLGNCMIHIHDIDYAVPVDEPLIESPRQEPDEVVCAIGKHISALVEDGSTLELGIGRIPHAVLGFLKNKKNLGLHSEMLADEVMDLIEAGVINGARKSLDRGKAVCSFVVGTKRFFDYLDNNPTFSMQPSEYVNDPFIISSQHKMVAINVALEVDLTGQVCADSLGTKFYSGVGGQSDFNRGAGRSHGGRAIIALPSTAKDGTVSRITSNLSPGAGVVTTRGAVHYVVTEHGVAFLHGKNVQERAMALISIAHPKFRKQLLEDAIEYKFIRRELAGIGDRIAAGPPNIRTTFLTDKGTQVSVRPIHPTDEHKVRDLYHRLSEQSLYSRFMSRLKWVPREQIQESVFVDYRNAISIVATVPDAGGEEIIAIAGYYLDTRTNRAEIAFVVKDEWQRHRIGTALFKHLVTVARQNGIAGFTAEVLEENKSMQAVFNNSGLKVKSTLSKSVHSFEIDFD